MSKEKYFFVLFLILLMNVVNGLTWMKEEDIPHGFEIKSNSSMQRKCSKTFFGPNRDHVLPGEPAFKNIVIDYFRRTNQESEPEWEIPTSIPQDLKLGDVNIGDSMYLKNMIMHNYTDFLTSPTCTNVNEGAIANDLQRKIRCSTKINTMALTGRLLVLNEYYPIALQLTNATYQVHHKISDDNLKDNFVRRERLEIFSYDTYTFSISIHPQNINFSIFEKSKIMNSLWQRFADEWLNYVAVLFEKHNLFNSMMYQQRQSIYKEETKVFFKNICSLLKSGPDVLAPDTFYARGTSRRNCKYHRTTLTGITQFNECFGDSDLTTEQVEHKVRRMTHKMKLVLKYDLNNTASILSSKVTYFITMYPKYYDEPVPLPYVCKSFIVKQIEIPFSLTWDKIEKKNLKFSLSNISTDVSIIGLKDDITGISYCFIGFLRKIIALYLSNVALTYFDADSDYFSNVALTDFETDSD